MADVVAEMQALQGKIETLGKIKPTGSPAADIREGFNKALGELRVEYSKNPILRGFKEANATLDCATLANRWTMLMNIWQALATDAQLSPADAEAGLVSTITMVNTLSPIVHKLTKKKPLELSPTYWVDDFNLNLKVSRELFPSNAFLAQLKEADSRTTNGELEKRLLQLQAILSEENTSAAWPD